LAGSVRFSMDKVCGGRLTSGCPQPRPPFGRISVIAELLEGDHLCADRHFFAVDSNHGGAALNDRTSRSGSLKTDEDHCVARIGEALYEVMQNAAAGHHTAGGHDDAGKVSCINLL